MKKVALLFVAALFLAACHCERRTTGTPCRKAACQCARKAGCPCKKGTCAKAAKNQKDLEAAQKAREARRAAAEKKAQEQAAALASVGTAKRTGNVVTFTYKEPIRFGHDSDVIASGSFKQLNATAAVLKKYPQSKITVKGYTDSLGDPNYNIDLSRRRAQAVADALAARGVKAENITAVGYGAANPVASNKTAAGRAQNRRVELTISAE